MPRDLPPPPAWKHVVPTPAWLDEAEALWHAAGDASLEQNPRFLRAWAETEGHEVCLCEMRQGGLAAYAAFDTGPETLDLLAGELTLYRHKITRMRLSRGLVAGAVGDGAEALAALLAEVNRARPEAVIYLQGLPAENGTEALLAHPALRKHFVVLRYGRPRAHYAIDLPAGEDAFFAALPKNLRGDLRRVARHLQTRCDGEVAFVTCTRPEEVASFLDEAVPVSQLTFQYRLVNAGLSDRPKLERQFRRLAEEGMWRGHLLRCHGRAVAFVTGYRIGAAYYFYETGYDPAWAHASVGKILLVEILKLLLAEGTVRRFDFLYGDQDYKRRLANRTWQDIECYLLPRTARNRALAAAIGGTRAGAELAGRVLDRWGLKARLRALIRRGAVGAGVDGR